MKEFYRLLLGYFIVIASCFSLAADQPHLQRSGANLIANPDVSGSAGWEFISGMYDSTVSRDGGTGSFKMTITYPNTNYSYIATAWNMLIPVTPGKTYTLACYMRSDIFPPAVPNLFVGYYNSSQVFIRNSPSPCQSVTSSNSWQECVYLFRPQPGEVYVKAKCSLMFQPIGYTGTIWVDNFYLGEGIGFEQAPTAKTAFNGSQTKVDALGNVQIYRSGAWVPFFPIAVYADTARTNWSDYSAQGFNANMWAGDYTAIQRAKDAASAFNPNGMMSGFQIANYLDTGGYDYGNTTLLTSRINDIKNNNLMDHLLWYYWDNENSSTEWAVPLAVTNTIRQLDVTHPIYALQGDEDVARKYNNSNVTMTDITGSYVTQDTSASYPDETRGALKLVTLDNIEQQQNPVVVAQINNGVGMLFRPRVFSAIAKGAKGIGFWRDGGSAPDITTQPWWSDLPNIRNEIDQLLPIIQMPHWTTWSLTSNNSLTDFGTRDYQGKGYVIATNEQSTAQSVTFTISNLPYAASAVRNFFTNEIESDIYSNQLTVTSPACGTKVYVLESNIEEMLSLKLLCNESGGATAYDGSYFANNGTLYGNAALAGGVLSLDGSCDYVDCGKKASLEMGKLDISVVARVKISTSQSGMYVGIVYKGANTPTETGYSFVYRTDIQKLVLIISSGSSRPFLIAPVAFNLKDNTWHTVGVSLIRTGNAEFYVDGVSMGTVNASSLASSDITNTNLDLFVGSCGPGGNYLNGQMDNIRIYKKALSGTEMADLSGNIIFDAQLNEASGTTAYDSSIYSSNGTLHGNAALGGGVMMLDGNGDYADFGNSAALDIGTNDMTIISRIKLDPTQNTYVGIVTKGSGSSSDAGYALFIYGGHLVFALSNGTTRLWLSSNNITLNDNLWHTVGVSVTRSGNAVFYVDGSSAGGGSASSLSGYNIVNTARNLQLGTWISYGAYSLRGSMDYATILKRALSSAEMVTATR